MEIQSLIATLGQLGEFTQSIGSARYADAAAGRSAIGTHVRHCLEHVDCLLGFQRNDNLLDYDNRKRDVSLEKNPTLATRKIHEQIEELARLDRADILGTPVRVRLMVDTSPAVFAEASSTVAREILFLMSHAIHHMAIIKSMCAQGEVLSAAKDFGIAPATRDHRRDSSTDSVQ